LRAERDGAQGGEGRRFLQLGGRAARVQELDGVPHRAQMESVFGEDFGNVRAVAADGAALPTGARAAAEGDTIAFRDNAPEPGLVAHELTHVVQQRRAGTNAIAAAGTIASEDDPSEREADAVAEHVTSGGRGSVTVEARPSASLHLDRGPGTAPDVSKGEIAYRRVWESNDWKVGPVEARASVRIEGALRERAADNQIDRGVKAGFGDRQVVREKKRRPKGKKRDEAATEVDKAATAVTNTIRTSLAKVSSPRFDAIEVAGVDLVLKADLKAFETKLNIFEGDADVSALTLTIAGEASLAELLDEVLADEFPWQVDGVLRVQIEAKIPADTIAAMLKLRRVAKDVENAIDVKVRHAATRRRIAEVEAELAERKRRKLPRTSPEIYDRGQKLQSELAELRRNEGRLAKLSRKADDIVQRAAEIAEHAKQKIAAKLGNAAERAIGKAAKEALEKGVAKLLAKAIPLYNAISTAQDVYEVVEFLASVDWIDLLEGNAAPGGGAASGSTKASDGEGTEGGKGEGADGSGGGAGIDGDADLTSPVDDPFAPQPHHAAAQRIVDAITTGDVKLGQSDHDLLDLAVPTDLSEREIAQVIAAVSGQIVGGSEASSGEGVVEAVISAVQLVRGGELDDIAARDEAGPRSAAEPPTAERKTARSRKKAPAEPARDAESIDLTLELERIYRIDGDRVVRTANSFTVAGASFTIQAHTILENSMTTTGSYVHLEVTLLVTKVTGVVVVDTHVPNTPPVKAAEGKLVQARVVLTSERNESPHVQGGHAP
jgi:hypothetical protein